MSGDDLDFGQTIRGFVAEQKMFGRYTLRRMLGRGGMGIVWLAKDEQLGDEVALKFVSETVRLDPEALDELKRETRRSRQLTHEHIVRIHDFAQDSECAAISMEYVDGWTLSALRAAQPQHFFEPDVIAGWIGQVCEGLFYAHDRAKIVHRDIKPANIMILRSGDVKIADFGISGSISESLSRISMAPSASGTLAYMSPQQMLGDAPSASDDIYSLGATIYELLTGKPPFFRGDLATQLRSKAPPSMGERRRELALEGTKPIPVEWESVVAACLEKEPSRRPQSIAAVVAGLFSDSAPARPAFPAKSNPPKRSKVLFPALIVGTGALAFLVLSALVGAGWYWGIYQPQLVRRQAEKTAVQQRDADAKRQVELEGMLVLAKKAAEEKRWGDAQKQIEQILRTDPNNAAAQQLRQTVSQASVKTSDTQEAPVLVKATPAPSATPSNPLQAMAEAGIDPFEKMKAPISPEAQRTIDRTFARMFSSGSRLAGQEVTFAGQVIAFISASDVLRLVVAQQFNGSIPNLQIDCARLPQEMRESLFSLRQAQLVEVSAKLGSNGVNSMVPKSVRPIDPSEIGPVVEKMEAFLAATGSGSANPAANSQAPTNNISQNTPKPQNQSTEPDGNRPASQPIAEVPSNILSVKGRYITVSAGKAEGGKGIDLVIYDAVTQKVLGNQRLTVPAEPSIGSIQPLGGMDTLYVGTLTDSGGWNEVIRLVQKAAESGASPAQFQLGKMSCVGWGLPQSDNDAVKWYRMAADQGNPMAQNNLGAMYLEGKGVRQSDAEAANLYRLAAEQGLAVSQKNLAVMYAAGNGLEKSDAEAVRWLQAAAKQGNAEAQTCLAEMYSNGRGVPKNDAEASSLYRLAADQGDVIAQANLGLRSYEGMGMPQSDTESVRWYRMAADQGNAFAQANLGAMYLMGKGVVKNAAEAARWLKAAAAQGNVNANNNLGTMYRDGNGVGQSDAEAIKCYRSAANQDFPGAQVNLGLMYATGRGVAKNSGEAFKLFRAAAAQGNSDAQVCIAAMYADGNGVQQSNREAVKLLRLAADQRNALAQYQLGVMYEKGAGVQASKTEAVKWFRLSANQGNPAAKDSLKRLGNRN